jgi:hypothetical protein
MGYGVKEMLQVLEEQQTSTETKATKENIFYRDALVERDTI